MLFSSITFIFTFLPITLFLYYLGPRPIKNLILLCASLIFYAWGEPVYLFLMMISIVFNYLCGLDLDQKSENRKSARNSLILAVTVNLLILGFFKYYGFLIENLNLILPTPIIYRKLSLPVGISFYTFQTLSYLIDVYRGKVRAQKNIITFGTYIAMFPQLIAGPIVQYADIEEQLSHPKIHWNGLGEGAIYFIRGLGKKVLLANAMGEIFLTVNELNVGDLSILTAWLGCAAFTFQIYFDFSGYSDMAVGLGKMLGLEFVNNFNYPYISKSITEFWRRWHISLGSWFREYVYIPLGGNRKGAIRHIRNMFLVWVLTGLWHGASWNFVAWGLYYFFLLFMEKYVWGKFLNHLPNLLQRGYSIVLIMLGWVFFFSDTLGGAMQYIRAMFGILSENPLWIDKQGLYLLTSGGLLWIFALLGSTPVIHKCFMSICKVGSRKERRWIPCMVYFGIFILCIGFLITESYNPFLYFRF